MPGVATSEIEVSLISNKGFWLLLKNEELLSPIQNFPVQAGYAGAGYYRRMADSQSPLLAFA